MQQDKKHSTELESEMKKFQELAQQDKRDLEAKIQQLQAFWQREKKDFENQVKLLQIPIDREVILSSKKHGDLTHTGNNKQFDATFMLMKVTQGKSSGYAVRGVNSHEFLSANRHKILSFDAGLGKEEIWRIIPKQNGKYIFQNGNGLAEEFDIRAVFPVNKKVTISLRGLSIGMNDKHKGFVDASDGPEKEFELLRITEGNCTGYGLRSIYTGRFLTAHDQRGLIGEPQLNKCEIWEIYHQADDTFIIWNRCYQRYLSLSSQEGIGWSETTGLNEKFFIKEKYESKEPKPKL